MAYYIFAVNELIAFANGAKYYNTTIAGTNTMGTSAQVYKSEAEALTAVVNAGYAWVPPATGTGNGKEYTFTK